MVRLFKIKNNIKNHLDSINSFLALGELLSYYLEEAKRFALKDAIKRKINYRIWFCELKNPPRYKIIKKAYEDAHKKCVKTQ